MVKHKGLCPSLKRSVEFDVNEVIELKTKRGTKYQVKGDYEGRTCSTFCSKEKAMELKSALGQTTMSAETEDETGQAHQDESVAPIDNNVQPLAQGQEPMTDMPVQETVATPITGTSVGVEAIDNLQLNDADALANMATQFDDAPDMVADFEIAPQEPEGDGRSIGNIRPMNEDVPLHAESEDGTGQAHQEEGVAPIETDVQPLAEGQEPMEDMPIQETVATPITNSSVGVEAIDNLQLNDADALANMATQFDEAPEMLADFEISFMQPFGDGQSVGNNTPMNPDVPLHAETFESPIQTVNPMDETTLTTPPPVCFVEKIPPVVWENMSVLEQIEYAETGNESLLSCPQCGITKADLRDAGGYCAVSDPEGSEYISSVDCPYQKHFAPSHWLDEEYVVGHVEGDIVEVSERLPARVDMPKMKNPQRGLEEMVVPYFIWDKIYTQFNGGITAEPDLSGLNYTLQFHGMMKPKIKNLIKGAEGNHDIMFGSETYTATVLKAEGDGGYFIDSTTVRPYEAETFEAKDNNSRREWTFLWKPASDGYGNSVYASSLEGAKKEVLRQYPQGSSMYGRADLSTLTDDATVNKRRWRDWDSQWNTEEFEAEQTLYWSHKRDKECSYCGYGKNHKAALLSDDGKLFSCYKCNSYPNEEEMVADYEAETFEADGGMEFAEWLMNNKPELYFSLLDEKNSPNMVGVRIDKARSMDFAEWMMYNKPELYFSLIDERGEGFSAETFNVEFDDWADQEMLTHGKTVSFKEWAKEEGKKHGDMDLTDWAEEEEESHDERYGAEEYEVLISDNNMDFGDSHKTFNDETEALEEAWELSQKETDKFVYVRGNDGKVIRVFRPNLGLGAESFEADYNDRGQKLCPRCRLSGYERPIYADGLCVPCIEELEDEHDERYGAEGVKHYERLPPNMPDATVYDFATVSGDEKERLSFAKKILKEEFDENTHTIISYRNDDDTLFYRIVEKKRKDKPSLKSVGLLLGVGALATYFAPKSMRDFLNRLK